MRERESENKCERKREREKESGSESEPLQRVCRLPACDHSDASERIRITTRSPGLTAELQGLKNQVAVKAETVGFSPFPTLLPCTEEPEREVLTRESEQEDSVGTKALEGLKTN